MYIYIYLVTVCDHEITHRSYVICRDKIYIKLYGLFLWMSLLNYVGPVGAWVA